jgi:hypothetical protein
MGSGTGAPLRAAFITSTPLNVREGSGTFVGIATLADALRSMGVQVDVIAPGKQLPILTPGGCCSTPPWRAAIGTITTSP